MGLRRLSAALAAGVSLAACADVPVAGDAPVLLEARPDAAGPDLPPPTFEPDAQVARYDSPGGRFRVHYATRGPHALPPADVDADGVPDYAELVAREYDRVLRFFVDDLGFLPPRSDDALTDGGAGRFDVYLVDFPTRADGAYRDEACTEQPPRRCAGYMLQENDFDGRGYASREIATRTVASHELFHAVQSAHAAGVSAVLSEATAVWASEAYDPSLRDFERAIGGYLARPERSLGQEPTGPVDGFSYGAALFFRFLEETRGRHLVRALWETLGQSAQPWPEALDQRLRDAAPDTLSAAFAEFALWNLHTADRADRSVAYADGAAYPAVSEKAVRLPFADPLVRMAPLSARYFVAPIEQPMVVRARLTSLTEGHEQLAVQLRVERAGRLLPPAPPEPSIAALEPGDRLHMLIVDARVSGPIRRIAVCLGPASEPSEPCPETGSHAAQIIPRAGPA